MKVKYLLVIIMLIFSFNVVFAEDTKDSSKDKEKIKDDEKKEITDKYTPFQKSLIMYLVDSDGKRVKLDKFKNKDFLFIYFSAKWCGGCQTFSKELVEYYNKYHKKANFEVILHSYDKNEEEMYKYMKEYKMNWLTINYHYRAQSRIDKQYASGLMPTLVIIDKDGKVIFDTVVDNTYIGPEEVLYQFSKKYIQEDK